MTKKQPNAKKQFTSRWQASKGTGDTRNRESNSPYCVWLPSSMMRACVFALAIAIVFPEICSPQSSDKIPEHVLAARNAVVLIRAFDDAGKEVSLGSGFFVDNGRLVSNAHVVTGATRVEVFDNSGQFLGGTDFAENLSTTRDLVVLPKIGDPPYLLAVDTDLPSIGDRVIAIGSPLGLSNTISEGIVSGIRSFEGQSWIQTTAPISPGSSGGPLIDYSGQVVGVTTALMQDGQNLNFVVPSRDVAAILRSPPGKIGFPRLQSLEQDSDSRGPSEEPKSESRGEPKIGVLTNDTFTRKSISFLFSPNVRTTWQFAAGSNHTNVDIYVFTSEADKIVSAGHAASNGMPGAKVVFRTIPGKDYAIFVESETGIGSFRYLLSELQGGRWIQVTRTSAGAVFLADSSAITRRTATTIETTIRIIPPEPEKTTWRPRKYYDEIQDVWLLDCRGGITGRISSTFLYRGDYVDSYEQPSIQWSQPSSDSAEQTILEELCFLAVL